MSNWSVGLHRWEIIHSLKSNINPLASFWLLINCNSSLRNLSVIENLKVNQTYPKWSSTWILLIFLPTSGTLGHPYIYKSILLKISNSSIHSTFLMDIILDLPLAKTSSRSLINSLISASLRSSSFSVWHLSKYKRIASSKC